MTPRATPVTDSTNNDWKQKRNPSLLEIIDGMLIVVLGDPSAARF